MAVCVRLAGRELAAPQIACVRFLGSSLVMLAATRGAGLRPRRSGLGALVVRGLLGTSAVVLYFAAVRRGGAALATLIHSTYPVFAALGGALFLGERFTARVAVALLLGLSGVAVVLGPGGRLPAEAVAGGLMAFGSAAISGAAVTTARGLRRHESAAVVTTWFMVVGAVATLPALAMPLPAWSASLPLWLAGVVLTSVGGQFLLHQGLGVASAVQAGLAGTTSVVTAALVEAVWLGTHLGVEVLVGATLMLSAVALAARPPAG